MKHPLDMAFLSPLSICYLRNFEMTTLWQNMLSETPNHLRMEVLAFCKALLLVQPERLAIFLVPGWDADEKPRWTWLRYSSCPHPPSFCAPLSKTRLVTLRSWRCTLTARFPTTREKRYVNVPTHRVQRIRISWSLQSLFFFFFKKIASMTHSIHSRVRIFILMQFVSKDSSHWGVVEQKRKTFLQFQLSSLNYCSRGQLWRTVLVNCTQNEEGEESCINYYNFVKTGNLIISRQL